MLPRLFEGYRPGPDDLLVTADGALRPAWQPIAGILGDVDPRELVERRATSARLAAALGAGHLLHDAASDPSRPSLVDALPFCTSRIAWDALDAGLAQRVRLLEALLADLYGPRRVVASGVVPAAAVFAEPGFRWAVARLRSRPRRWLGLVAADVAPHGDGSWTVLRMRTDAPTGAGYVMANRSITTRLVPHVLRRFQPQDIAPWSVRLRQSLAAAAPAGVASPRVVVMTTGTGHPAYFEHSYLAAELGFNLVEDADLTVRNGRVWLRSLGALEPVDVVMRRVEDHSSDPLDIDDESVHGVAGLARAAGSGRVGVTNMVGSALAQSPLFECWTPALCEALLGEDLLLPGPPTRWLGDPAQREEALAEGHRFAVVDLRAPNSPITDPDRLAAAVALTPERLVAIGRVPLATAPTLDALIGNAVAPGISIRTFITLGDDGPAVMPAGAARAGDGLHHPLALAALDVWVPSAGGAPTPVPVAPARPALPQVDFRASLPTRTAEALYWMGRNAERAEVLARVMLLAIRRLDVSGAEPQHGGAEDALRMVHVAAGGSTSDLQPATALVDAVRRPGRGLAATIGFLIGNARSARSFVSSTSWRIIADLREAADAAVTAAEHGELTDLEDVLDRAIVDLAGMAGLASESVVRGPGWHLLDLGRRLERAQRSIELVSCAVGPAARSADPTPAIEAALMAMESLIAYRRRYRSDLELGAALELLVMDPDNPRAIGFQLSRIAEHLAVLPDVSGADDVRAALRRAAEDLQLASEAGRDGFAARVRSGVLRSLDEALAEIGTDVVHTWFSHRDARMLRPGRVA